PHHQCRSASPARVATGDAGTASASCRNGISPRARDAARLTRTRSPRLRREAAMAAPGSRTVVANICLSLDGRVTGPGGEYDMSWTVRHAVTDAARDHLATVIGTATTALIGRRNYQSFASFWPAVAEDDEADARDRAFARWLNAVEKIVFSTTLRRA